MSFAITGIIVIGMTIVMVSGGIDISVGAAMVLVMTVLGTLFKSGVNVWIAAVIALVIGALVGVINGFFIARVGLSAFITTLATYSIARGAAFVITQGTLLSLFDLPANFRAIGKGYIGGVPYVIIIFVALVVIADFMMRRSAVLRKVAYMGASEKAAVFSGVDVRLMRWGTYILCSFLAGVAGVLNVARFGTAFPSFGAGTELLAISACVIGGASLAGGVGTILGSVVGIALLAIVTTSLILLDVSIYWQELASGLILLFAVSVDYLTNMRSK
ncbi:MAG: ABC transporter permease [Spirochaetia bacterium]